MSTRHQDELRIAERAAEWHGVLNRAGTAAPTEQTCAEFMAWLEESPKHVREFLLLQAWEIETQGIDAQCELSVEKILSSLPGNVVPLQRTDGSSFGAAPTPATCSNERRSSGKYRLRWLTGLAAAAMIAGILLWQFHTADVYTTSIGELRAVDLSDGSKIELSSASQVKVDFSDSQREVRLLQGEALFKVQADPSRPFRVRAGASVIQAIGTQFTVNRRPLATVVAVIDGKVRVYASHAETSSDASSSKNAQGILSGGEQARIDLRGGIEKREPIDDGNIVAWRQRRLTFRDDALADIAAEFNRHNRSLQIEVEGEAARNRRYGGIFDADNPQSIVRFLEQDRELVISREGTRILIRAR